MRVDDLRAQYPDFPFARFDDPPVGSIMNWLGLNEEFPADQICDRSGGTVEYFICQFYDPVLIDLDGELRTYPPGTLVIWAPGQPQVYGAEAAPFRHSYVFAVTRSLQRLMRTLDIPTSQPLLGLPRDRFEYYIYGLIAERFAGARSDSQAVENLLANLVMLISEWHRGQAQKVDERAQRVRRALETRFAATFSLADLARLTHVSVPHLCALYKQAYGVSPLADLATIRIRQARYLLQDQRLSVAEVARRIGYEDPKYFSRVFRQHVGVSPRAFRTNLA